MLRQTTQQNLGIFFIWRLQSLALFGFEVYCKAIILQFTHSKGNVQLRSYQRFRIEKAVLLMKCAYDAPDNEAATLIKKQ